MTIGAPTQPGEEPSRPDQPGPPSPAQAAHAVPAAQAAQAAQAAELRARYLADAVATATPAMRVTMLFDRMLLDLRWADEGFDSGDLKVVNDRLVHAQEIVLALRATLRTDLWDGAPVLADLYRHLYEELVGANMTKDRARARSAAELLGQLGDAWRGASERLAVETGRREGAEGLIGAGELAR